MLVRGEALLPMKKPAHHLSAEIPVLDGVLHHGSDLRIEEQDTECGT